MTSCKSAFWLYSPRWWCHCHGKHFHTQASCSNGHSFLACEGNSLRCGFVWMGAMLLGIGEREGVVPVPTLWSGLWHLWSSAHKFRSDHMCIQVPGQSWTRCVESGWTSENCRVLWGKSPAPARLRQYGHCHQWVSQMGAHTCVAEGPVSSHFMPCCGPLLRTYLRIDYKGCLVLFFTSNIHLRFTRSNERLRPEE